MKQILILLFTIFIIQNGVAQEFCTTSAQNSNFELNGELLKFKDESRTNANSVTLKVYAHIVRRNNSTGGYSNEQVNQVMDILQEDFNPHGIFFEKVEDNIGINNSTLYNSVPTVGIYNNNNHQNGIDMYLFPPDANGLNGSAGGRANGIGFSTEFYIFGDWTGQGGTALTNVVSHEMGHVLNLYHTHQGTQPLSGVTCPELVNGSNAATCGDMVEDTPADPCICLNVDQNCNWLGSDQDANGESYLPDNENIMSYAGPECVNYFSCLQGFRMLTSINLSPHLQSCIINEFADVNCKCYIENINIESNETLAYSAVNGIVTVNYNATLVIDQEVKFSENSKIIVKPGGKLIVDGGGLLTNCPDGNKWQGVHLEGPSETFQLSLLPGIIEMRNGGTIENAVTGIDTRNNFAFFNYTVERGGGIVRMDSGSKIDNCEIGIYFASLTGKGIPFNSPYAEEQSVISNSFISNCDVGIYMNNNNGLEVNGTVFTDNYPDVESHQSSFDFTGNTFHYGIEMFAEYPNFQGANIISNNFVNNYGDGSVLFMESQGNAEPIVFDKNSTFGFGMRIFGDAQFFARNNDFYDGEGIKAWESGDNQFNMVVDNAFFGNEYGSSVNGVNDIEYLTNCFESTQIYDIEVNNSASIHEAQGDPFEFVSAGNCFEARIGTSSGSEHFDYWTKDGYTFVPHECKYPGDGNFTRQEAESEAEGSGCGTFGNYTGTLPRSYRDCKCGPNPAGCIDMVNALIAEIDRLDGDDTVNEWVKRWLIAKYRRCITSVQKSFVKLLLDDGRTEDAINHLSALPSFRLRIMAYALMMNAHEIDKARTYLNSLNTDGEGEQAFVNAQNIYLDYLLDRSDYKLDNSDRNYLLSVSTDKNPYSGYIRSIYYKLTGERIDIDFEHLNGKSSTRAVVKNPVSRLSVFPNPINDDYFNISIDEFSTDLEYTIKISSLDGRVLENTIISDVNSRIDINGNKGVYIVQLFENNKLVSTQKLVKL
jgi:hypothetical protein